MKAHRASSPRSRRAAGTPIWVWLVYGLGILAAAIFAFSAPLHARRAGPLERRPGRPTTSRRRRSILWGGLIVAAVVTWFVRRRQRDEARPHQLREHGAGLLRARGRRRGGLGRPDGAQRGCCSTARSTSRRSRRSSTHGTPTGCGSCRACASRQRALSTRSSSSRACRSGRSGRSPSRRRARRRSY